MKRNVIITCSLLLGAIVALAWIRTHNQPVPRLSSPPPAAVTAEPAAAENITAAPARKAVPAAEVLPEKAGPGPGQPLRNASALLLAQTIDRLCNPLTTYEQRQEIWQQLSEGGKLDEAMTELEQRMKQDASNPEYPASLGRACLQKAGTLKDVREQGMLGLKADQMFDAALSLDSQSWEARFWKASAMSYWPAMLNKGTEVMQHFVTLIEQQEAQPVQSHYALSYLALGDQYQKNGHKQLAKETWERGAIYFPDQQMLQVRLANAQ